MTIDIHPDMVPVLFDPPVLMVVENRWLTSVVPDFVREIRVQHYAGGWDLACITVANHAHFVAQARAVHTLDGELWPGRWPALPEPWPHPSFG